MGRGGSPGGRFRASISIYLILMVSSVFWVGQAQPTESSPLLSGCETDYPPFCMVRDDGRADGFSVELLVAALQRMGQEATFRTGPWSEVRGWLERSEVDVLPLVGRTPEREKVFDFTVPYMTMHGALVVRTDTADVRTLDDLTGRRVAVMEADNAEEFLRREARDFEIVTTRTFTDALHLLADGGCDAVVIQRLVAIRLLQETGLADLKIISQPVAEFSQDFCFAVHKGNHALLSLLNEGLSLVVADGTHRRLYAEWFARLELPTDRTIVIGGDHNYPPFEFLDEHGRPVGYNVDLIWAVAQAVGLSIEVRLGPWAEMLRALGDGKVDAMQGMFYSPERDQRFDFSQAHIVNHSVAVVRTGEGSPPASVQELEGMQIIVQNGDIMHDFVIQHGVDEFLTTVDSQEDALRALLAGERDVALVSRVTALYLIDQHGWKTLSVGRTPLLSPEYCFAVPHGSLALLAELSEGLRTVQLSGEYRRIQEKWLGVYEPAVGTLEAIRVIAIVIGPLVVIALLALLWVRTLRRRVVAGTAQLRRSAGFQRAMVSCAPVALYSVDAQGIVVNWNESAERIFGWTAEEIIGQPLPVVPAERQGDFDELLRRVLDGDQLVGEEMLHRRRDGMPITVSLSMAPVLDEHGKSIGLMGAAYDITERTQAERAVRESQAHLASMLNAITESAFLMMPDGIIIAANDEVTHRLRPSDGTLVGKNAYDALSPQVAENRRRYAERVVASGRAVQFEDQRDGRSIHNSIYPVFDGSGQVAQLAIFGEDITERRQSEERVTLLGHMLDKAPAAITVHDEEGRFLYANQQACALHGYADEVEYLAVNLQELDAPESAIQIEERMQQIAETGEARFEVAHHRKDGSTFPLSVHAKAIEWDGRSAILSIAVDIAERRQAEEKLQAEKDWSEAIIASAPNLVIGLSEGAKIQIFNAHAERVTGHRAADVMGTSWIDTFIAEPLREEILGVWDEIVAGRLIEHHHENEILTKHAGVRTVSWSNTILTSPDDEFRMILSIGEDVTDRRRVEQSLHESEARFRRYVENAPYGVFITDAAGRYLEANHAAVRIIGYTLAQLKTMSIRDLLPPNDMAEGLAHFQQLLETGSVFGELALRRADGALRYCSLSAVRLSEDRYLGFAQDIHDRKQTQLRLARVYRHQKRINGLSFEIGSSTDTDRIHQLVDHAVRELMDVSAFIVSSYDADTSLIRAEYITKEGGTVVDVAALPSLPLAASGGNQSTVLREGVPVNVPDYRASRAGGKTEYTVNDRGDVNPGPPPAEAAEITRSALLVPMRVSGKIIGVMQVQSTRLRAFDEEDEQVLSGLANVAAIALSNAQLLTEVHDALEGTILATGRTMAYRDPYTAGHQQQVSQLASAIGRACGLEDERLEGLRVAALLHDLGKIAIPAEILSKPTALSTIEMDIIRTHPRVGHELLAGVSFPWPVAEIILQHHERLDGSGYPGGIPGEAMLREARILAVADVVEAMASYRPYRPSLGIEAALQELEEGRGVRYDAEIVDVCLRLFREDGFSFEEPLVDDLPRPTT